MSEPAGATHARSSSPGGPRIGVAGDSSCLTRGGAPWALVADTVWSAFTHVPEPEWDTYVAQRATQGFTSLLISVLPILHDMSDAPAAMPSPFPGFWDGRPRWGAVRSEYLDRARRMLAVACAAGLTPILVTLWCSYAPATWASGERPSYVMPDGAVGDYLASVVDAFDGFDPVWMVAGDADFHELRSTEWYAAAEIQLRALVPDAVTCMHTQDTTLLPDRLAQMPGAAFYGYQSGHRLERQDTAWEYAEHYLAAPVRRPIIDLEPPYEGHGHGFRYGRFSADDVRRASWQALCAGASAGIGYGAHGVWSWHRAGATFSHTKFSSMPFDHRVALRFTGADDVARAGQMVESLGLLGAPGRQDLLVDPSPGVRAMARDERVAIYVPYAGDVRLADGVIVRDGYLWDPATGDRHDLSMSDGGCTIIQAGWNGDALAVLDLDGPLTS